MTDKELRRLGRVQLLELLVEQGRENERLRLELEQTEEKLGRYELVAEEAGSITIAVARLNAIFEKVQEEADQYLPKEQAGDGEVPEIGSGLCGGEALFTENTLCEEADPHVQAVLDDVAVEGPRQASPEPTGAGPVAMGSHIRNKKYTKTGGLAVKILCILGSILILILIFGAGILEDNR